MEETKTEEQFVTLMSQEGETFAVPTRVAKLSGFVGTIIEDDDDSQEIPLPNIRTHILAKVITFFIHYVDIPALQIEKPLKNTDMAQVVPAWDAEFIDLEQAELFELILAANYLDAPMLLDLSCAKVASMIKGRTPEEIRQKFNIVNDFTPEEEAHEEIPWIL